MGALSVPFGNGTVCYGKWPIWFHDIYIYTHTDYIDALYYLHYYALLYFQQFSTCWNFHSCVKFTRERMGNTIQQRPSFGVQFVAC
jgi:hypothetical protein